MFARNNRLIAHRARLYDTVRTAHLERAHELQPAAIIYQKKRYDFDESLVAGLELVKASPMRASRLVSRSGIDVLEINEPLMLESLVVTCTTLARLSLRRRFGLSVPTVVTYAIGNADPFLQVGYGGWKTRLRRRLERRMARFAWNRVDRIAYGTTAAQQMYEQLLPARPSQAVHLIEALPSRCPSCVPDKDPLLVVYLGALVARKGFPVVADAWPHVLDEAPSARMQIIGKGALENSARDLEGAFPSVILITDPPRSIIHEALARAQVVVLPSQSTANWREQVGLPIVEALAHGCSVVSTDETGLADWLREHGHSVVAASANGSGLAEAIVGQLARGATAHDVTAALPSRDGRLAADDWLFRIDDDTPSIPGRERTNVLT